MLTKSFAGRKSGLMLLCCSVIVLQGCASKPAQVHSTAPVYPAPRAVALPETISTATASTSAIDAQAVASSADSGEPASTQAPLEQPLWTQRGLASWYGKEFQGRRTASGELFDALSLTAAHRTLPIPSLARVRHLASGRQVIVRINDRGPFHGKRVLDLSHAAAVELDMVAAGSAEVVIEVLPMNFPPIPSESPVPPELPESPNSGELLTVSDISLPPSPSLVPLASPLLAPARAYTPAAQGFWVQLAAVPQRALAEKLQRRVSAQWAGLSPLMAVFNEARMFQLQAGPYPGQEEALDVARWLQNNMDLTPVVMQRR
jgi:rare lipoprotein A